MSAPAGRHLSLWLDGAPATDYAPLKGTHRCEVAVAGAGITGLSTALLLALEGRSVAVLEQWRIGTGTTGHTTGKVTSQHGATYLRLRLTLGREAAATYGEANEAAKERIAALAEEGIECDFRRRPAYLYATSRLERVLVEREANAAAEAGLPASFVEEVPLPYATHGAARFDNQAEFHPHKYLVGLARRLEQAGGLIFERTRATQVHEGRPCRVETEGGGEVLADDVVVATLMPFLDRGAFFARAFPSRSYAVSAHIEEAPPNGMFINVGSPKRSIRSHPGGGDELLLVGGEGHHVGAPEAQSERYDRLIEFARRNWNVASIEHHWSSQDYSPDDGVPYVGPVHLRSRHVHVATGLKKWGITGGTVAAMLIRDAILGRQNRWAKLFASTRFRPLAEAPKLALENAQIGLHFAGDRLLQRGTRPIEDLAPGEGDIVNAGSRKVAGYRDEEGHLHAVSTRCTHLYCQVRWNAAERTWDCPCHGSRFTPQGDVLNGPAVRALGRHPTE
jgi:glycine/D-amino acid oxidase-like deaminating enzyme/nitrite reductase/ring-hydroxylating ferredoxin subunit